MEPQKLQSVPRRISGLDPDMRKNLRQFFMLEKNKNETEQEQILLGRMSPMLRAKVPAAKCSWRFRRVCHIEASLVFVCWRLRCLHGVLVAFNMFLVV